MSRGLGVIGSPPVVEANSTRLLILDKNPLELIGLKTLLSDCDIKVHSEDLITDLSMIQLIEEWLPQAVLADVGSYDCQIDTYTRSLRRKNGMPVLWLSPSRDERVIVDAVVAGAAGCVTKTDFNMIASALDMVLRGDVFFPTRVLADFAFEVGLFYLPSSRHLDGLSERERLILMLVREGATNHKIASELNVSVETVKVYIRNIRQVFGAISRRQLVTQAPEPAELDDARNLHAQKL